MLANDGSDSPLPVRPASTLCPKHLRGRQRLSGKPAIPGIDRGLVVRTGQVRMCDREVQVVLEGPEGQQLHLSLHIAAVSPDRPD
jgi:hypothetical protein